jgi:preprotein translocase subunit SecA
LDDILPEAFALVRDSSSVNIDISSSSARTLSANLPRRFISFLLPSAIYKVLALEEDMSILTDEEIKAKTSAFQEKLQSEEDPRRFISFLLPSAIFDKKPILFAPLAF